MFKVMSLHIDAGLKSFPPLINGLMNDSLPIPHTPDPEDSSKFCNLLGLVWGC